LIVGGRCCRQPALGKGRATSSRQTERSNEQLSRNCFQELRQWEDYFAYPGHSLLKSLDERIASGDAAGTARLVQSMSAALLTHSYRTNAGDWEGEELAAISLGNQATGEAEEIAVHRPSKCWW